MKSWLILEVLILGQNGSGQKASFAAYRLQLGPVCVDGRTPQKDAHLQPGFVYFVSETLGLTTLF
jgi:hypothetical protein